MTPGETQQRDRAAQLAQKDPKAALKIARKIDHPWFRCQALAHAAQFLPDPKQKKRVLQESFVAALDAKDVNRKVSVSSWPLKVLCKSGDHKRLAIELQRLLDLIATEPSPVRRAHATNLLLGAVVTGPRPLFRQALDRMQSACLTPLASGKRNKRGESHLARWAVIVHRFDPALARQLLRCIKGPTYLERAERGIVEYEKLGVEDLCRWPHVG